MTSTEGLESETGRALWFTGPRQAELIEEEVPPPGPGQVRVRADASLVSAGTEMIQYRGEAGSRLESDLPTSAGTHPFPIKFAYQTVGRVEAAGNDADFAVGERVFAYHPHQDVFTMHAAVPAAALSRHTGGGCCSACLTSSTRIMPCSRTSTRWR